MNQKKESANVNNSNNAQKGSVNLETLKTQLAKGTKDKTQLTNEESEAIALNALQGAAKKGTKENKFLYKFQIAETKIEEKKEKAMRKKLRTLRNAHMAAFIQQPNEKNFKAFDVFYKREYIVNDYSFSSFAQGNTSIENEAIIKLFLRKVESFKTKK